MGQHRAWHFRGAAVANATNEMRACTETVRAAAVWADTTRLHPRGQEGVQAVVDVSFRVAHQPRSTPFVDTSAFIGTNDWICEKSVESANSADPCDALRALADLTRRTSDQLVQSRKQKLEDRRLVRLSVAEDQIDGWRISLQRAARYRRSEKVLCVIR